MDWFQIGKGVCQECILSPCLFNLYAEHIVKNASLDESQAGIKTAKNLIYVDDTTIMAESKEELKRLLIRVKEKSEKYGLKSILKKKQKNKIIASGPITSWQIDGREMETVIDFILGGSRMTVDSDCSHEIKIHLLLGRKAMRNLAY